MNRTAGSFESLLAVVLLVALAARVLYVLAQPAVDPTFATPMLDGAYYAEWARSLLAGDRAAPEAYYLAPLYPWVLAALIELTGDRVALVYLIQHAGMVVAAWMLALVGYRLGGVVAGLATCVLVLAYHPTLFFASSPLGEWLGLVLVAAALLLLFDGRAWAIAGAGAAAGLACLARPNLLLVVVAWVALELGGRRWRRAALLAAAVGLVIAPVTVRNWWVSGHAVPISANAGMTLFHGNSPGSDGIGVLPPGFTGRVDSQATEAVRLASREAGRELDTVEADRWWGRKAIEARLADLPDTAKLLARRVALTLSNEELSLDYAPAIDDNPWRRLAPVPFALLVALAVAAIVAKGGRATGGAAVWLALAACACAPILFYVSSRYRLPFAFLLCLPAGVGVAALSTAPVGRGRLVSAAAAVAAGLASLLIPVTAERGLTQAAALANRAVAWSQAGDLDRAQADLERAVILDPRSWASWFGLGVLEERRGRTVEAATAYEKAITAHPAATAAACNLARLRILSGRVAEGHALARRALNWVPYDETCWAQVITAAYFEGGPRAGREATAAARSQGVVVGEELIAALERLVAESNAPDRGAKP